MNDINIASLNINEARDFKKRMEIYEFVKQQIRCGDAAGNSVI